MAAAFVVYIVGQLEQWHNALACAIAVLSMAFMAVVIWGAIQLEWPRKILYVPTLILLVLACIIQVALPSRKTAEYMAAAYGVQYAVQSETGQQIIAKSGKIVNNVLDRAIEKTSPSK
jgi:hypothetical protein